MPSEGGAELLQLGRFALLKKIGSLRGIEGRGD